MGTLGGVAEPVVVGPIVEQPSEALSRARAAVLERYSEEELKAELFRRMVPTAVAYPNFEALERYIKEFMAGGNSHRDAKAVFERRTFELSVTTVFGQRFLDWYRKW